MIPLKRILKFFLLITIILLSNTTINAQKQNTITVKGTQIQVSPSLQKILNQVETVYVKSSGFTLNNFCTDAPDVIPTFIGLIMHRQKIMMKEIRSIKHLDNAAAYKKEILAFLEQLAKAHNYRNPIDNTSMTAARLNVYYLEAVRGDQNNNFKNNMGIDPTKVQLTYMLDKSPSPINNDGGEYAKLQIKNDNKENDNEIILFGESVNGRASHSQDNIQQAGNVVSKGLFKAEAHVCPDTAPMGSDKSYDSRYDRFFEIKQGNPDDYDTKTTCYYKNNLLLRQDPRVKGKKHGLSLSFFISKSGKWILGGKDYYINDKKNGISVSNNEFMDQGYRLGKSSSVSYTNGKLNGPYKYWGMSNLGINYVHKEGSYINEKLDGNINTYIISKKTGKVYLRFAVNYRNGKALNSKDYFVFKTGKYALTTEYIYENDEVKETIYYHSEGGVKHRAYYQNGKYTHSKCWYKNGKEMKNVDCFEVDWRKTDWCEDIKTCNGSNEF